MTVFDLALTMTPGLGVKGTVHLLERFGSADAIFAATHDELTSRAALRDDVARRIVRREGMRAAEREAEYCRRHDIRIVASTDEEYPPLLRLAPDRPHILYLRGSADALRLRTLSMVGTREMSPSGQYLCDRLVRQLAERLPDLCIVSGLAYGVDAACHRAALAYGARTVAVVANALPGVSPAPHRRLADEIVAKGGAIVSELHSQTHQNGAFFLARNRIIAAMSQGLVVVESPAAGGSLATAAMADSYDRTVMAIPGRVTDNASRGTNNLIRNNKARLVMTADDILDDLMWQCPPGVSPETAAAAGTDVVLSAAEATLLACFTGGEIDRERLAEASGLQPGELAQLLMELELKGAVRSLPGRRYEKIEL